MGFSGEARALSRRAPDHFPATGRTGVLSQDSKLQAVLDIFTALGPGGGSPLASDYHSEDLEVVDDASKCETQ